MRKIIGLVLACLHIVGLQATINFGSPQSALEANGGSITFNPSSSVTLSNGTLRDAGSAGNIGNANGKSMACTGMTIETKEGTVTKAMVTDGTLDTDGGTLGIGNNQVLTVNGGTVAQAVTASGSAITTGSNTPSIIQGYGAFGSAITVSDNSSLVMRWQGPLNQNITLTPATADDDSEVKLEHDLIFAPGKFVTTTGTVNGDPNVLFNGYSATFNGATIDKAQNWHTAKVNLDGSLTLNAAVTLTASGNVINAQGNDLGGSSGFAGSQDATLINGKVTTATVLGGTGEWTLDNVLFNYNSAAARVVSGSVDTNTALLSGAVSLGASTIELLSDVTAGGTWTLTGALQLIGNGHKLDLSSNNFAIGANAVTVSDGYLAGLTSTSLGGSGTWTFTDTILDSGSEALRVLDGSITSDNTNLFGGAVTWGASTFELLRNVAPGGTWTLTTGSSIHGNDKKLDVTNGLHAAATNASFTLTDIYLDGVTSNSLKSATGADTNETSWSLTNVTFDTGTEAFKVLEGALENTSNGTSLDTDPFTAAVTWTAANIELLRDTSPSGAWTVATSFALNGNGHKFDTAGVTLPASVTGTLRDVTIDNFDSSSLAGTSGSSVWNMHNVTLDSGSEAVHVVSGSLTTNTNDVFGGAVTWGASTLELKRNVSLGGAWTLTTGSAIHGNGKKLNVANGLHAAAHTASFTLSDVYLDGVTSNSLKSAGSSADQESTWSLTNVTFDTGSEALRVLEGDLKNTANETSTDTDPFTAAVTWTGANMELLRDTSPSGAWTIATSFELNGNGHKFDTAGITLPASTTGTLRDVTIDNFDSSSLAGTSGTSTWDMHNVTLDSGSAALRVVDGSLTSNSNDVFAGSVNWGATTMEMLTDVSLGGSSSWTFANTSVINGNGHVLDLTADPNITLSAGTLTLSNMVITGWGNGGITFTGARLILSNVTIILDDNVTLETTEPITVNGPLTINTGANVFNASAAGSNNKINGVTVWYDTLGAVDNTNAKFGVFTKDTGISTIGRVTAVGGSSSSADQTYSGAAQYVTDSLFLNYDVDVPVADGTFEASGQQVTLDNSGGAFTLQGNGRTFYMGNVSDHVTGTKLVTVGDAGSGNVTINDLTFDGWSASHFADSSKEIRYSDGSILKLNADETLTTTVALGAGVANEAVVLDLNGYDLDLGSDAASLSITETTGSTITIKNGRIINLDDVANGDIKILPTGANPTLVFQDVDLVLAGDTTLTACNIQFKGDCSITGTGNYELKCYHTPVTITDGARLRVDKSMTLGLYGDATTGDSSITFGSNNSTLELIGATLDVSNLDSAPTFTHGTMRIDDIVTLTGDMTLGSSTAVLDLDVDLMPAASIVVDSGTVTYVNG